MLFTKLLIPLALFTFDKNADTQVEQWGLNDISYQDVAIYQDSSLRKQVELKIKKIIVEKLAVDENEVLWETNFTYDLGADLLDWIELILEFEEAFTIAIPDPVAEKVKTVGDAIEMVEQLIKKK